MEKNTKARISREALKLFARKGYMATSMSDIAKELNLTKAALYKHYTSKQEILDSIVARMREGDKEQAEAYEMPEGTRKEMPGAYREVPMEAICRFTGAMFRYWTEEEFPSCFRRMLTLEQYHDPEMAAMYQNYLADGPVGYMTDIFRQTAGSEEAARQMALEFYGPVFLLYSVYDGAEDKESVKERLDRYLEWFSRSHRNLSPEADPAKTI